MVRKKKVIVPASALKKSKKILGEPFSESKMDGNSVGVDILHVNERGVIVLPKGVREKLNAGQNREFVILTMSHKGEAPTIMLVPAGRLGQSDKKTERSLRDVHGPD